MSDLDNLLIEAMNSEKEAKNFYEKASIKAESKAGKKLFKELAEFEKNHYKHVKNIIESRKNNSKIQIHDITTQDITIKPEIEGEIEKNKDEIITVLNMAIDAEIKAQERYRRIANLFKDEVSKKIFFNLSQEERNHQRILEDEIYQLSNKGSIIWE